MMELKISKEKDNKVIGRKELNFEINYERAPPNKLQIIEELAKKTNTNQNLIVIKKISNVFGMRKLMCNANIYGDEKSISKFEPKYILNRIKKAKEK